MREIIFKAKTCNGEWVEGLLANKGNKWYISNKAGQPFAFEVRPDTICQYTGLTDKNGRKIWENDIVRTQEYSDKPYSKTRKTKRHIGVVEYDIGKGSGFYNEETEKHDRYCEYSAEWSVKIKDYGIYCCGNWGDFFDCEVIGNVFDNPELLKGGA